MISQEELEYAIARYKARLGGHDLERPTPPVVAGMAPEELEADAYQVEESASFVAYSNAATVAPYGGDSVPQYVPSMSDSSLIELGDDAIDPDNER